MSSENFKIDFGHRLKLAIVSWKISQQDFAISIGYTPTMLSQMLKGKKGLSSELISIIYEKYPRINWDWLITGRGEMEVKIENSTGVVLGDNNGTMQVHQGTPSADDLQMELILLRERVKALEEQMKLKDEIINLLKK